MEHVLYLLLYTTALWFIFHLTYKRKLTHITKIAYHDSLTGLPNRLNFKEGLREIIQHHEYGVALIMMDLDNFKSVNDTYGHQAGDDLLIQVADRLHTAVRKFDTVYRLHGDEFAILIHEIKSEADIHIVATRILDQINEPWFLYGEPITVTASFGIRVIDDFDLKRRQLMREADIAMYHAKDKGKNNYAIWYPEMPDGKRNLEDSLLTTPNL